MNNVFLSPPVAFTLMLISAILLSALFSGIGYTRKGKDIGGMKKSYACGENVQTNLMQPDYSQFFPFAFFFTILHVVTLMIATVPVETVESCSIAAIYILGAATALLILFRR